MVTKITTLTVESRESARRRMDAASELTPLGKKEKKLNVITPCPQSLHSVVDDQPGVLSPCRRLALVIACRRECVVQRRAGEVRH